MTQTILGDILHPECSMMSQRWREWRLTYESGQYYIENYLVWFKYESQERYSDRKDLTYVPAFAKEAVNEVRNSLWSRLPDIVRSGGSNSYRDAMQGLKGGVDKRRSKMGDFIGRVLLPEILSMRRVGVWIDMPPVEQNASRASTQGKHPYLVWYPVESIRSWATDDDGRLTRILLKQRNFLHDEATGLPMSGSIDSFLYAWLDPESPGVHVRQEIGDGAAKASREYILDLEEIPFVQFEIEHSLLEDICGHQKALLNMESADVAWCVQANFPTWTQQFDPRSSPVGVRPAQQQNKPPVPRQGFDAPPQSSPIVPAIPAGQAKQASEAKAQEVTLGPQQGIGYPKDLERPGWVHPSSEPITASMAKEMQIKEDIRRIIHLSVATLDPQMASAESKHMDDRGLQLGLCAIGAALQRGEQEISHHWHAYERTEEARVQYPDDWAMQNDEGRRKEAKGLIELRDEVPSITFRKEVAKQIAGRVLGHRVPNDVIQTINGEVDEAKYLSANVKDITLDIQNRTLSAATAAEIRGYGSIEAEKALKEQANQLAIVAISQAKGGGVGAARGVGGHPADQGSVDEKKAAANASGTPQDTTRGAGKLNEPPDVPVEGAD